MTNEEKFKTAGERSLAYASYCKYLKSLNLPILHDTFSWLGLEYNVNTILKPCPFCGSRAEVKQVYLNEDKYYIACSKWRDVFNEECVIAGVGGRVYDSLDEAIAAWNRRA